MFQQTFVPENRGVRRPLGVLFSLSLQAFLLVALVLIRLAYVPPIPMVQLRAWLAAPTPPLSQQKPVTAVTPSRTPPAAKRVFVFQAPSVVPRQINPSVDYPAPALPDTGAVGTQTNAAADSGLLTGLGDDGPPPPLRAVPKPLARPVVQRIGGAVMAANIVNQVQPVYPTVARSARIEGTVEYTATIDKTGRVVNLQLQHGHPLLVKAASDAILQWRYKPTMLNGEPVDVLTTITVNFKLSS